MRLRFFIIFNTRSAGHLLHCNGGGSLSLKCRESFSNKRFFQNSSPAPRVLNEAIDLLILPDASTSPACFVSVLKSLGSHKALQEGKLIHHLIMSLSLDYEMFVAGYLVRMYAVCAAFDDAFTLFSKLSERNVFTWNFLIRACARHGENDKVFILLQQMQQEAVVPTKVTLVSIFDACATLTDFGAGHRMHALLVHGPFEIDVVVGTALVNMYGSYGNIAGVWLCFHKILERDVIAWTALFCALFQQARQRGFFFLFEQMLQEGVMPNEVTFISLCGACVNHSSISDVERVHARVSSFNEKASVALENALITMYNKCGSLKRAETIFIIMEDRSLVSWTAIISAYSQNGFCKEACQHFSHMLQLGVLPDNVVFTTILATCASSSLLALCKHMHVMILIRNPEIDVVTGTVLVNTYGKCQDVGSAKATFEFLADRNIYCWNAVIAAFTQNSEVHLAERLFNQMLEEGVLPNKVTFVSVLDACGHNPQSLSFGMQLHACILEEEVEVQNALIDMYGKSGKLEAAQVIFGTTLKKDSITWTALIAAFVQHGQVKEALSLFERMCEEGLQPDEATFVIVLSMCDSDGNLAKGQQVHAFIVEESFEQDVVVSTALVSMYGRCDSVEDARSVFDAMGKRNGISWNAMIAIHEQAGQATEALELFGNMQSDIALPDYITFVTIVSACIAQFALGAGRIVHAFILESGCLVDIVLISAILNMYGKCGSLEDAQCVFDKMQERNVVSWNTMIALFAQHGLALGALSVFDEMQAAGMLPSHITFVNILGACSHCGFLYEACHYVIMMGDFTIYPTMDVYVCLIDLFGRAGCLDEAEIIVNGIPLLPSPVAFMALLGACRYRDDVERGSYAAKHASEMEPENRAPHLVLSNLYAAVGRIDDAALVMSLFEGGLQESGITADEGDLHDIYTSISC